MTYVMLKLIVMNSDLVSKLPVHMTKTSTRHAGRQEISRCCTRDESLGA